MSFLDGLGKYNVFLKKDTYHSKKLKMTDVQPTKKRL